MYFVEGLTNTHGGESTVRRIGEYAELEDAIRASEQAIDQFLAGRLKDGMSDTALFALYQKFGEVPFIFSDDARTINVPGFNHFKYAVARCREICAPAAKASAGQG